MPRSLGNMHYILAMGIVCGRCNSRFAQFENLVLTSDVFIEERRRLGLLRPGYDVVGSPLETSFMKRFLLKMAYESLYKSKRKLWTRSDLEHIRQTLLLGTDSTRVCAISGEIAFHYRDIPTWTDRFRLKNNGLRLQYAEDGPRLYFRFTFGRIVAALRIA